jgi:uracil phosphoribosyltransferase
MKLKNVKIVDHPLAASKLWHLRNKATPPGVFRSLVEEISQLLAYEMTSQLKTKKHKVVTPLQETFGYKIAEPIALIPIMRAGQAMLHGMLDLLPFAAVGHIGIYRDKFINNTVEYYFRMPKGISKMHAFVLDPLLATGDTAVAAISRLKEYNVSKITFVSILAAREGVDKLIAAHPDVMIYCLNVEPEVDRHGYILPGIGDAGDRIYGTHGAEI